MYVVSDIEQSFINNLIRRFISDAVSTISICLGLYSYEMPLLSSNFLRYVFSAISRSFSLRSVSISVIATSLSDISFRKNFLNILQKGYKFLFLPRYFIFTINTINFYFKFTKIFYSISKICGII